MAEKLGIVMLALLMVALILAFGWFVYAFGINDGDISLDFIETNAVLGATSPDVTFDIAPEDDITFTYNNLLDEETEQRILESDNPGGSYSVEVVKLDISATVPHTNSIEQLQTDGWIVLPWSYLNQDSWFRWPWAERLPKSEAILMCYRTYFGQTHPASCYKLNNLSVGDEIIFDDANYQITNILIRSRIQSTLLEPNTDGNLIKLITTSGPNGEPDQEGYYLVVLGEKIDLEN